MKRIMLLLFIVFFITACSGYGRTVNTATEDFYTGTQGVTARFDHLPSKMFFYRDAGPYGNEFEVGVEVHNRGASWTRGAVFLSGYDPNLIVFKEVPLGALRQSSCGFSFSQITRNVINSGYGVFGGIFSCGGASAGLTTTGDIFLNMQSSSQFAKAMGWSDDFPDFSVSADTIYDQTHLTVNFLGANIDMDYWGHGRLFLSIFSGVNFLEVLGREYVMPGRSYEYPTGDLEFFSYSGNINPNGWAPGLDEVRQPLLLTNCYYYTTFAAPLVCIDPDPYSDVRKVCNPRQLSFSGSQGAPVAITSIEQEAGPRSSTFRINIQNVGRGEVYDPGQLQKCSPYIADRVSPRDKNVVVLGDIRIGNQRLIDCTPKGVIRLQNGRGTITCNYPYEYRGMQSAYETPLYIELWYGYSETEQRTLNIKRVS